MDSPQIAKLTDQMLIGSDANQYACKIGLLSQTSEDRVEGLSRNLHSNVASQECSNRRDLLATSIWIMSVQVTRQHSSVRLSLKDES